MNGLGLRRPVIANGDAICGSRSAPHQNGEQWHCTATRGHGGPLHAALDANCDVILDATWPIDENWPDVQEMAINLGLPADLFGGGLVLIDEPDRQVVLKVVFESAPAARWVANG